jgi:hypothetical protein
MVGINAHDFPEVGYWTMVGVGTISVVVEAAGADATGVGGLSVSAAVGEGELLEQLTVEATIMMINATTGPNLEKFARFETMEHSLTIRQILIP